MAGMGLVGAGGVTGAYEGLEQLLARRMMERKQALAEQEAADIAAARQQQMQLGGRQADLAERRFGLEEEIANRPAPPPGPITMAPGASLVDPTTGRLITKTEERPPQPPGPMTLSPGGRMIDPSTGRLIAEAPPTPERPMSLAPGASLVDPVTGRVIRTMPEKGAGGPEGPSPYAQERTVRNRQSVKELQRKVNNWTTGLGSSLAQIPATEARNFKAELDTLKANIGFGELTAMREASKTGGALGQVSDRELQLLTSALGALDTGQSPENFAQQLKKIGESLDRWEAAQAGAGRGVRGGVRMRAPDGRRLNVPADKVADAERRGAVRE